MLAWYHLLFASVSAALVTLLGHWLMAKRDERRRARRAFAQSIHKCCEELEEAAIRYWAGKNDEEDAPILAAKMKAALMKMIRFINAKPRVIDEEVRRQLELGWFRAQKTTGGKFETQKGRSDPERAALMVGIITAVRAEIAGMMAE